MNKKTTLLLEKLKDKRSKKVMFISHCLLNENTRYLGGAFRKSGVDELIDYLQEQEVGIVQMKCPEQKAWGGVLKQEMLQGYAIKGTLLNYLRKPYMRYFIWKTKRAYRRQAKEVILEIKDYLNSDFEVLGIVVIKGSPTCGLSASLDLLKSSEFVAGLDIESLDAEEFNNKCYKNCLINTEGLFVKQLKSQLASNNLKVNFFEHDLLAEMSGKKLSVDYLGNNENRS
jgi:uncharacterized protein YbbK (DUF523 family)